MRQYIVGHLLGIGAAAVVVVALWWGWPLYDGMAQTRDTPDDDVLTVGQCIEADASVGPLEEALIKAEIIEEDLLQTKVTNGMCKDMLEGVTDGTQVQKLAAAQNYIQKIGLIKGAMREATVVAAARGTDWYSSSDESLVLFRAIAQTSEQVAARAQYDGPDGIEPIQVQAATISDCSELSGAERSYDEALAQCEAAAERAGASPRQAAAGTRCSLEVDVVDDEVEKIEGLYQIMPQIPEQIRLREPEEAGLLVSRATEEKFREIKEKYGGIAEASEIGIGCVELTNQMKAKLESLDFGFKADIDRNHSNDILKLTRKRDARWGWDITARQTGELKLVLDLSFAISREGQEFRKVPQSPVYEETLRVTPRPSDPNQDEETGRVTPPPPDPAPPDPWWQRILERIVGVFGA